MTAGFLFPAFMVTHKGLHNGMVCGVHVGVQREGTLSLAIVRCISLRSDDPVLREGRETERNYIWRAGTVCWKYRRKCESICISIGALEVDLAHVRLRVCRCGQDLPTLAKY